MDYEDDIEQFLEDFFKDDGNGKAVSNNFASMNFTVHQVKEMIEMELRGRGSKIALKRLHRRYTKLRAIEEWKLLDNMRADWNIYLLKKKTREGVDQHKGIGYKKAS